MVDSCDHNSFEAKMLRLIREHCLSVDVDFSGAKTISVKYVFDQDKLQLVAQGYHQAETRLASLKRKLLQAGPVEQELADLLNLGVKKGFWDSFHLTMHQKGTVGAQPSPCWSWIPPPSADQTHSV